MAGVLAGSFSPAQEKPPQAPVFPATVELITVDAVVLDERGQPVAGLTKDDFVVREDGRPQALATFEAIDLRSDPAARREAPAAAAEPQRALALPASSVLLIDDVGLSPALLPGVRAAVERFVSAGLREGDEVVFATTSRSAFWSARMPEGREDVLELSARVRARGFTAIENDAISEWEAFRVVEFEGMTAGEGRPGSGPAAGGPPGSSGDEPVVPGASISERLRQRFMQKGLCHPPPREPPQTCYARIRSRAAVVDARRRDRTRDVLAAVDRAVFALTGVRGRKALLLFSEGFLNDPGLPGRFEIGARCREANVAVYFLDVRGLTTGLATAEDSRVPSSGELGLMRMEAVDFAAAGSVALAEDTGGAAIRNTNDIAGGALRIAEESRVYYLLGYAPPAGKGPREWRSLKVEVTRPGLVVRARKGHTLRTAAEILAADEARIAATARRPGSKEESGQDREAPLPAALLRALVSPRDAGEIPVRAMPYVLEARPGGRLRTLVVIEADTSALANLGGQERPRAVLSLSIAATHRDSGELRRVDQRLEAEAGARGEWDGWLSVNRELELLPGVVQARVVVRDEFLGRIGAATVRFVVPPASGLRLSTPVLTQRLWRPRAGPVQPVPPGRREFEPAGKLFCQFQVFGATAKNGRSDAQAEVLLRRRGGKPIHQDPMRPIEPTPDGRLIRLVSFPLDGLSEGDYELGLRVVDGAGEAREQSETFTLRSGAKRGPEDR
jgi:hypothetical protein